ncbi:uncharacterized protein K02A2.6-like [Uranotaenia lowii]|uniref:uncharacterized protein K02A2.6-like n=1 Tax=Uranotaenia lowii TaxID=190385 RepID=UPI00247AFECB|nr:uncharacterized protein K02A2.6-like [Uranotaenia lowii]
MNRYKFSKRDQGVDEMGENFILAVKLLAENCNFKEFKDEAIRDRLVFGMREKELQYKILMEDDISLETVERMIVNSELAGQRAKIISENSGLASANILSIRHRLGRRDGYDRRLEGRGRDSNSGYRVRSRSRERDNSRERNSYEFNRNKQEWNNHDNARCNYCKRRGHIRKNCFLLNKTKSVKFVEEETSKDPVPFDKFNRMRLDHSEDESDIGCMMISRKISSNAPCMVEVIVEGKKLLMEVDTGSAASVISMAIYLKQLSYITVTKSSKKLVVVNGAKLSIFGEISVEARLNSLVYKLKLIILQSDINFTPLLGRDWLELFYPEWRTNFVPCKNIMALKTDLSLEQTISNIKSKFDKVFTQNFSEPITGYKADLTFKSYQPIFKRAYEVPFKIRDQFVKHLDMLESQGVISPVKASEWASPVIAVLKKDNDIRMVIDCKIAIGNHVLTAHKHQLKMAHVPLGRSRVFVSRNNNCKRRRDSLDSEAEFQGFPDEPLSLDVAASAMDKRITNGRSPIITRSRKRRLME